MGGALLGGAIIGGGLSLIGAHEQSRAAKSAASTQATAISEATALEREIYYQNREDLAPWLKAGERSLADLEKETDVLRSLIYDPSSYKRSPDYEFLLEEGINALNRDATMRGKFDSGERSKDLLAFGQNLALSDYQNALSRHGMLLNRLAGTAGVGQSAVNALTGLSQNYATNVGNLAVSGGNAIAGGIINQANARTGLYSNLSKVGSNALDQYIFYNALTRGGGTTGIPTALPINYRSYGYEMPGYNIT